MQHLEKLRPLYQNVADVFLNTSVLFLVVNIALFFVFSCKDYWSSHQKVDLDTLLTRHMESMKIVYPEYTEAQIRTLWQETLFVTRPSVYEPYTQFKERPFQGKYVTVSESGFRHTKNQGPWPPDPAAFNICVFGGSTTFGYGVADSETLSSYLQAYLSMQIGRDTRVYNFGRSGYFSTQERILFEQLLTTGFIPNIAIFVDGFNDFRNVKGQPQFTNRLTKVMQGAPLQNSVFERLPIIVATRALQNRMYTQKTPGQQNPDSSFTDVVERYLENKHFIEVVAAGYGVKAFFVWQPVPIYKYDLSHHLFSTQLRTDATHLRPGYEYMARLAEEGLGDNFLWLADIQEHLHEPLYVDPVHYTPRLLNRIAVAIGDWLLKSDALATQ